MKRLDKKDLLLSPKVVSDLTGGNNTTTNKKNEDGNPDAATGKICVSAVDTCFCTNVCNETLSENELCCQESEKIESKCCVNPPYSVDICELSEVELCPETQQCPETQVCPTTMCNG